MSVFNLTYATTQAVVGTLRAALTADPLFQPDRTKLSRSADTIVMDAWGYQIRDFPVLVVTGVPGRSRRVAINDRVRPFFGVALAEDPVSGTSPVLRTFDVPLILNVDTPVEVRYVGDPPTDPAGPFSVLVQEKTVASLPVRYVEVPGTAVGPASAFPLAKFEASTKNVSTGEIFGGWWDLDVNITIAARSTQTRELLTDRVMSLIWFLKKKELRKKGIVVLDVSHGGVTEEPYGQDMAYYARLVANVATEFEAILQHVETVEAIETVTGVATETL